MKATFLVLGLLLACGTVLADEISDCDQAESPLDRSNCRSEVLKKKDAELRKIHNEIMNDAKSVGDESATKAIAGASTSAFNSFVKFRKDNCELEEGLSFGGTEHEARVLSCQLSMTEKRIEEAKKMRKSLSVNGGADPLAPLPEQNKQPAAKQKNRAK